jgi:hypothetical protein
MGKPALNIVEERAEGKERDVCEEAAAGAARRAEAKRRAALLANVRQDYRVDGSNFYFRARPDAVAFKDSGAKLITQHNSPDIALSMAAIAEAKGWKGIAVSGHPDFCRELWLEARLRGLSVKGYTPKEADKDELAARLERTMRNPAVHREANEPLREPRRSGGEDEKRRVIMAVAEALASSRVKSPEVVERVLAAVGKRLDGLAAGRMPSVLVYDKAAASTRQDSARPGMEHSARTR